MNRLKPFAVVIPAHNEAENISAVILSCKDAFRESPIFLVDDASSDQTASLGAAAGAEVVRLSSRFGAWAAIQTGMRYAQRLGNYTVLTMDADGQHEALMAPSLLAEMQVTGANIVVGSAPSRGSPLRRVAWRILRIASGFPITDITSGFRLYDQEAVTLLCKARASYFEQQDIGVIALALENNLLIVEKEIEMKSRAAGASKIFPSWASIITYMCKTILLALSKRQLWPDMEREER